MIYLAFAEFLYKFHRLTLVEYGKFRMEFAPPKKDEKGNSRKPKQIKQNCGQKRLK